MGKKDLQYGWVIVAVGALMGCVAVGAMMSLAVFLQPITEATGWSRTGVSSAMTIGFLVMGAAGFAWGALSDRFGTRPVVLAGAVLLGLGLVLASRAASRRSRPGASSSRAARARSTRSRRSLASPTAA